MRLFRHYQDVPDDARGAVAAIGNFDGLHLGHQAILAETMRLAGAAGRPGAAISFEPHPFGVFHPGAPPFRLTPFRIKASLLGELGLDLAFVLPFDEGLYSKEAADFVRDVLVDGLGIGALVVGADFVFGRRRGGDVALLATLGRECGFGVTTIGKILDAGGEPYSSTKIRQFLAAGEPRRAAALLGRAWAIEGRVEAGDRRGRTIGFPTANLVLAEHLVPAEGVYAVRALATDDAAGTWRPGVANLGRRPTVDGERRLLEVHLFDFAGDLYGSHLRVALVDFLRPEKKFDGIEALRAQIARDGARAREVLAADATPLAVGRTALPACAAKRIV